MPEKLLRYRYHFLFLFSGLLLGFVLRQFIMPSSGRVTVREIREGGYKYINPLLECELYVNSFGSGIQVLADKLNRSKNRLIEEGRITDMSIYFRDLSNGPWIGIGEKEEFTPASLLKVPLMMAYYKMAENNPGILEKKYKYAHDDNALDQNIIPTHVLVAGQEYPVSEIIRSMIAYSDNSSSNLLYKEIDPVFLDEVYRDLGLSVPGVRKPEDFMTVKNYASFFRILFNASYLEKNYSEEALRILTLTDFKDGLVAGVPDGVAVAHKFGERNYYGRKQLHDCGIIYHPRKPYLLCIMTRGGEFEDLVHAIKSTSEIVYQEVNNIYK